MTVLTFSLNIFVIIAKKDPNKKLLIRILQIFGKRRN